MSVLDTLSTPRLDFSLDRERQANRQRQAMQQVFLHDILNTAGSLKGVAELLVEARARDDSSLRELALNMAAHLVEEITAQRELMAAEAGTLETDRHPVSSLQVVRQLAERFEALPVSDGKRVRLDSGSVDEVVETDIRLLDRVLGNMVLNALEAETEGATISIGCEKKPGAVRFWVRNPGYILPANQARIFDGSFSTKGHNRGLGTYSMLLLGEKFLKGSVGFSTDPDRGTTFHITLSRPSS